MTAESMANLIREAVIDELKRQAEISNSALTVETTDDLVTINGPVDIDDLVMVVIGSVAGGP
jgi:osmotically-inducible protein OsmY